MSDTTTPSATAASAANPAPAPASESAATQTPAPAAASEPRRAMSIIDRLTGASARITELEGVNAQQATRIAELESQLAGYAALEAELATVEAQTASAAAATQTAATATAAAAAATAAIPAQVSRGVTDALASLGVPEASLPGAEAPEGEKKTELQGMAKAAAAFKAKIAAASAK